VAGAVLPAREGATALLGIPRDVLPHVHEAEINKLVWGPPAPRTPVGKRGPEAFKRTAEIALRFGVIKKPAEPAACTHEVWELARTLT
jgi:hypothetical protein